MAPAAWLTFASNCSAWVVGSCFLSSSALRFFLKEYGDAIAAAHRAKRANSANERMIGEKKIGQTQKKRREQKFIAHNLPPRLTDWENEFRFLQIAGHCNPTGQKNLHIFSAANHRRVLLKKICIKRQLWYAMVAGQFYNTHLVISFRNWTSSNNNAHFSSVNRNCCTTVKIVETWRYTSSFPGQQITLIIMIKVILTQTLCLFCALEWMKSNSIPAPSIRIYPQRRCGF